MTTGQEREPATRLLAPAALRLERAMTLAVVVLPCAGVILAVIGLGTRGVSSFELALLSASYLLTGFGITAGFHRLLTHRAFSCGPLLRATLAVAGSLALQGPVARWVADHRRHHRSSDRRGDPHSPHLKGSSLAGLWHAHCSWLFDHERTRLRRFVPDLLADPLIRRIDQLYPLWILLSLGLPALLGLMWTGSWSGALWAFVWGGLVRVFLVHHVTWSINSVCHVFGARPYATSDRSTNCWWLSLASLGESWHNAHHAFPTSARHGLRRWQLDPTWLLIRVWERLGWARDVRVPSLAQLRKAADLGQAAPGHSSQASTGRVSDMTQVSVKSQPEKLA